MKTREDIGLEMKVSGIILDLVRDAIDGKLDEVPNGDIQGMCEAAAMTMAKYQIAYSGWTTVTIEANSAEEAEEKFDDECLSELMDWNVDDITEVEE